MFSASRRACSETSLLLFLFAIFLENSSYGSDIDDEIGQRPEDTDHLGDR